jgi:2-keto-4-pentenoate hydratase/2-oxohepta-3-ene-1,7-dioic acid hydratase in catechol pathway
MRIARFAPAGRLHVGAADGDDIVSLSEALAEENLSKAEAAALADTTALISAGANGLALAARAIERSRAGAGRHPLSRVKLAAPLSPSLILCSGENYWDHRDEKPAVEGKEPEFFTKTALGVIGPGDSIILDARVTRKLDYETELLVVIGAPGRHIPSETALDHVYGYSIMNDVTARDRQVRLRPDGSSVYALGPGKNFDTCAPIGPWIVTRDEVSDPQALGLRTWVNDELRQSNSTARMIWDVAALVSYFSTYITLRPGVVISTGTPGGTAWGTDPELGGRAAARSDVVAPSGYLKPGDTVRCQIEGIGTLENAVIAAA